MAMAGKSKRRLGISNSEWFFENVFCLSPDSIKSVWNYPNILAQKFPLKNLRQQLRSHSSQSLKMKDLVWLFLVLIMRLLSVIKKNDGVYIVQSENINADKNKNEIEDFKHSGKWQ
jgi:hypothetical protein